MLDSADTFRARVWSALLACVLDNEQGWKPHYGRVRQILESGDDDDLHRIEIVLRYDQPPDIRIHRLRIRA